jgi:hypothetical protein
MTNTKVKDNSTNIVEMVNWKKKEAEGKSGLASWMEVAVAKQFQNTQKIVTTGVLNDAEREGWYSWKISCLVDGLKVKYFNSVRDISHIEMQRGVRKLIGDDVERVEPDGH